MSPFCTQGRRLLAAVPAVMLVVLLINGCGDRSAPAQLTGPPPPPLEVPSGSFTIVVDSLVFNGCQSNTAYAGTYQITIDGEAFTMGANWTGEWDASRSQGHAESPRIKTVIRFCTRTEWTTVNITFTSEDEFFGSIVERRRIDGDCGTPCQSSWLISGIRQ